MKSSTMDAPLPLLSREEEVALAHRIAGGDQDARTLFIESNLRLVAVFARKYARVSTLPFEDLYQEGTIGLMRAVDKFDPARGTKFSTVATWWICQAMTRAIDALVPCIHIPAYLHTERRVLRAASTAFEMELGREPTPEQLATATGKTVERVLFLQSILAQPVSLDKPIYDHEALTVGGMLEDPAADIEQQFVELSEQQALLRAALATLNPQQRDVFCRRYGIDRDWQTIEQVTAEYAVSKQRISHIELRALASVRRYIATHQEEHHP